MQLFSSFITLAFFVIRFYVPFVCFHG